MLHVDAGLLRQIGHGHVRGAAVAARAVVDLAGMGLGIGNERGQVLDRQRGVDHQHVGHARHPGNGREALDRVVGQLGVQAGRDGQRAHMAHQQRIAVARGLGHAVGANAAARARDVLGNDRLAPGGGQLMAYRAAQNVGRAAGRERDDQAYCLVRVSGLGEGRAQPQRSAAQAAGQRELHPLAAIKGGVGQGRTSCGHQGFQAAKNQWPSLRSATLAALRVCP